MCLPPWRARSWRPTSLVDPASEGLWCNVSKTCNTRVCLFERCTDQHFKPRQGWLSANENGRESAKSGRLEVPPGVALSRWMTERAEGRELHKAEHDA
eukprot:1159478-Pelagomonas_calceolata.AAC.10